MSRIDPFADLVGQSPELQSVIRAAQIVARTDATVLIQGETGTGKELLARGLHAASQRATGPFVTVNCAALPETLVEAELFGHARGAYTGADQARPGFVRMAEGGTLFLDEIGELPAAAQARLLRLLENGEIQPVGEHRALRVDVRIVAATHQDLEALVAEGRFRRDLYYRLMVVPLVLPPLRERPGDVRLLAEHFLEELAHRHGSPAPVLTPRALARLEAADWPGNVRELRNLCERLCILLPGAEIDADNLMHLVPRPRADNMPTLELAVLEREAIRSALERTGGNKSAAARLLGISRDTLNYRLRKHAFDAG